MIRSTRVVKALNLLDVFNSIGSATILRYVGIFEDVVAEGPDSALPEFGVFCQT
jgi:hypothetical protein